MNIGIFGGSFNPIHLGHTALAQYICNLGLVDEVWLMVSPQNPLKVDCELLDENIRLELARLAVEDFPFIQACDFEFHLPRPSYTYITLNELAKAYPEHTFSLIIGGDNWDLFPRWRNSEQILANHRVIVYPRSDASVPENAALYPNCHFLTTAPLLPISSTAVREAIRRGDDISEFVAPAVRDRILNDELYSIRN